MFEAHTGTVYRETRPPQGENFSVTLLEAERGHFIVKTGDESWKIEELEKEARVLMALAPYYPGAPGFVARAGNHFLLTYLDGVNLAVTVAERTGTTARCHLAAEHGRFLRRLHSWIPDLPRPENWVADAMRHIFDSQEESDLNPISPYSGHAGRCATEVLGVLEEQYPNITTESVFGHGDWCLPNSLVQGDAVTGAIDWSCGGFADYRYDLATALWSLRYNLRGDPSLPAYLDAFLHGYGYDGHVEDLSFFEALYALL
jgi:aminoglycoside phosphotransferase